MDPLQNQRKPDEELDLARQTLGRRYPLTTFDWTLRDHWGNMLDQLNTVFGHVGSANSKFGGPMLHEDRSDPPAALPEEVGSNLRSGLFYLDGAVIVHLAAGTPWLLEGRTLRRALASRWIVRDEDGSYWAAFYGRCPHLACQLVFDIRRRVFSCQCEKAYFHVDGDWISGPSARSLDRFRISLRGRGLLIETQHMNRTVPRPAAAGRGSPLLAVPAAMETVHDPW